MTSFNHYIYISSSSHWAYYTHTQNHPTKKNNRKFLPTMSVPPGTALASCWEDRGGPTSRSNSPEASPATSSEHHLVVSLVKHWMAGRCTYWKDIFNIFFVYHFYCHVFLLHSATFREMSWILGYTVCQLFIDLIFRTSSFKFTFWKGHSNQIVQLDSALSTRS